MKRNKLKLNTNMLLQLYDRNGKLKDLRELHNVVTTQGKYAIADQLLAAPTFPKVGWCELGISATVVFTVTAANATAAATYTNNGVTFTVLATIAGGTILYCSTSGSSTAAASGTLTKASGTGDATITFSAVAFSDTNNGWPLQTLLNSYIASSRTVVDSKTRNNGVVTMVITFSGGTGTGAVTEAGIFNVVTQNTATLWAYGSFAVINKGASDTLTLTWTLTIS